MFSSWLNFYRGAGADAEGRTLHQILAWDDEMLESVHDYIQWLFPLPERSMFNANAPILTDADIAAARADAAVQSNLRAALQRMRQFYGLTPETADRPKSWAQASDHNHLRLTRILRSLTHLGLSAEARELFDEISQFDARIPERTRQYWRSAIQ